MPHPPPGLSPPTRGSRGRGLEREGRRGSIPAHAGKPEGPQRGLPPRPVYPRPRGEADSGSATRQVYDGLSPPTRGSRVVQPGRRVRRGSIPAHAGKPRPEHPRRLRAAVYPRPRGEAVSPANRDDSQQGLSPPTRGSRRRVPLQQAPQGSIPAHAGKPRIRDRPRYRTAVYPRPRGEASAAILSLPIGMGLSPPTRGSQRVAVAGDDVLRSIPAHAGKPSEWATVGTVVTVYPRPRGEAQYFHRVGQNKRGLSPPTRGSPGPPLRTSRTSGSIPAHAGKPSCFSPSGSLPGVYPRPRGEAAVRTLGARPGLGLSPPTRGSREMVSADSTAAGSIPAHAGKPTTRPYLRVARRVYPRPRGEASQPLGRFRSTLGLSPPTRGSLQPARRRDQVLRSIPAHAGKPGAVLARLKETRVYPRPRGEAHRLFLHERKCTGLSPPTRGSRPTGPHNWSCPGSIPAHAGKPCSMCHSRPVTAVYPRPRGEATPASLETFADLGLSPPTRGSPASCRDRERPAGSIPAHAGKPTTDHRSVTPFGVYPRPRGEAGLVGIGGGLPGGLSPPTRGSLQPASQPYGRFRSIPAHAGKPAHDPGQLGDWRVYPRPRGEAG